MFDVIVAREWRGKRAGRQLMDLIMQDLTSMAHVELYRLSDMEPFHRRWGFSGEVAGTRLLRRIGGKLP